MATNKILGYVISAVGLIVLLLSFSKLRTALKLTLPSAISETILIISGIVILLVGIFLIVKSGGRKVGEVPIYHGKEVVGYRRV